MPKYRYNFKFIQRPFDLKLISEELIKEYFLRMCYWKGDKDILCPLRGMGKLGVSQAPTLAHDSDKNKSF